MPPRLQCLNVARALQKERCNRATFSTSTSQSYADSPPSRASSLASIGAFDSYSTTSSKQPGRARSGGLGRPQPGNTGATSRVMELIQRSKEMEARRNAAAAAGRSSTPLSTAEELARFSKAASLTKQISRRWKAGDVYAPHDLSPVEMEKWKKRGRPTVDAMDVLDLNPVDEYKNFSIMSEYMTTMGRIQHSSSTGLRPVNQRRMAKAIRRSIGMGLMPSVHRHPEILRKEMMRKNEQMNRLTRGPL